MQFEQPTPILRIFDETKAKEFYIDFLEFKIDWEHRFEKDMPLYCQISKNNCIIHLSEHFGDCSPGSAIRIPTQNLQQFQEKLLKKAYKNARPGLNKQPWGCYEVSIADPFHNRLIFFENF